MVKAVLVIDIPENCSKCPFAYEFYGVKKCQMLNCLCKTNSIISIADYAKKRVEKCPLREIPERKEYKGVDGITADNITDRIYQSNKETAALGWNACLDEIIGGSGDE